ncbi:S9 family peptidase, partial [Streptomyces althioticus]
MQTQAYGEWPSPVDAATAAAHDGSPEYVGFVGDEVWWTEPRPAEAGGPPPRRRHAGGTHGSQPHPPRDGPPPRNKES